MRGTTIRSVDDDCVQREPLLDQKIMVEYQKNNHYVNRR